MRLCALAASVMLASPIAAHAFEVVYDPTQAAHVAEQIEQGLEQINKLKEQLKTAQEQLGQLTDLNAGFNQITDVGELAKALKDPGVTRYLPENFSDYSGSLNGLLKTNTDGFAQRYDHYETTSISPGNEFYYDELKRQKQETYTDMSVGQAVYDTASKRITELEKLRDRLNTAATPKEVMDLQARIQAESALLQNEVLRMQGLSMVQAARNRVDQQRAGEQYNKYIDEAIATTR